MAVKSTFIGNTAWVGELEVTNRKDASGNPYQAKSILFRVATRREYTVTKEVNGAQVKERPTDFISCRATGHVAQLIKDYASARKADGSLQSRVVEVSGHFETYKTKKEDKKLIERIEKRRINVNGEIYEIDLPISVESVHEVEYWQTMFIVDSINFWDSNASETTAVTATPTATVDTTQVISAVPVSESAVADEIKATTSESVATLAKPADSTETSAPAEESKPAPKISEEDKEAQLVIIPTDILADEESPF